MQAADTRALRDCVGHRAAGRTHCSSDTNSCSTEPSPSGPGDVTCSGACRAGGDICIWQATAWHPYTYGSLILQGHGARVANHQRSMDKQGSTACPPSLPLMLTVKDMYQPASQPGCNSNPPYQATPCSSLKEIPRSSPSNPTQPARPPSCSLLQGAVNFAITSASARSVKLVLFTEADLAAGRSTYEITLDPVTNKTGDVWHIALPGCEPGMLYAYRVSGPNQKSNQSGDAGHKHDDVRGCGCGCGWLAPSNLLLYCCTVSILGLVFACICLLAV